MKTLTTSTKHTPAPWALKKSAHQIEWAYWVDRADGRLIAAVAINGPGEAEIELANANLIAAAPELLAALTAIVYSDGDCIEGRRLERARVAVAKARGD